MAPMTNTSVAERDLAIRMFEVMTLMRAVEDRMVTMYRQGELLGSLYTGHWHEAIAVGAAFALKYRGTDGVAMAYCGDGASSRGDFHEALNLAAVHQLPCVFVVENNQYAYSTPLTLTTAAADFASKAVAYGMPGTQVDGIDVFAVHGVAAAAVARARAGDGPSLIEAVTMRMHGHAEHDPADYVPAELHETWA